MTKTEIIEKLKSLDKRLSYDDKSEYFVSTEGLKIKAEWDMILELEEKLNNYICNDNSMKNDNTYEVLATFLNDRIIFKENSNKVECDDFDISFGEVSDAFALYLFSKLEKKNIRFLRMYHRFSEENLNVLEVIRSFFKNYISIKINIKRDVENITATINSYLFNLAYKKDICITIVSSLKDFSNRDKDFKRDNSELEIPRRLYNEILTRYYIYASSTIAVSTKYLTFYNVLEYFFVDIYEEDICKKIQSIITSPDFSYKSLPNFKKILKEIPKTYKKNNSIEEIDALKLTLKKYLNIDDFKEFIYSKEYKFDSENILSRSKRDKINIEESDDQIISSLANRIYSIRNAIVHSKNDDVNISYIPLKHDAFLEQEIGLIKYLAEKIIINSSKPL